METKQDKDAYKRIMFDNGDTQAEIDNLKEIDQKEGLARYLSQKVAFEAVYKPSYHQDEIAVPQNYYHSPSVLSLFCCCFYPEQYQTVFGVTTQMFKKKLKGALMFWKNDFLEMPNVDEDDEEGIDKGPDLYGPVWLIVLYTIVLGLAANLNDYFSLSSHSTIFVFQTPYISSAVAINAVFRIGQIIIYPAVMGCLDAELSSRQAAHLTGYSMILYIIPTIFCIIPNKTSHFILLVLAAVLRGVFLARNFATRIRAVPSKGIIYFVVGGLSALEYIVGSTAFFAAYYHPAILTTAAAVPASHPLKPLLRPTGAGTVP